MIPPKQLTRIAARDHVAAKTVERDYVIHHVLSAIGKLDEPRLVFKGGTCLRACHVPDYRYSADLDFSTVGMSEAAGFEAIGHALKECKDASGFASIELVTDEGSGVTKIVFDAVLPGGKPIKVDLQDDELVEERSVLSIFQRYPDVPPGKLMAYAASEIAGEKLRCVLQRSSCRDLYDLHHLLTVEGIDVLEVWPVFERKAQHRGKDSAQFGKRLDAVIDVARREWEAELGQYVHPLPVFATFERELRRALRPALR
jgi:predicted nucleotidyltransferase component of viral defense system